MPFTATTVNSDKAWAPDLYAFAPTDVLPDALMLQCTTVAGNIEGDAPSVASHMSTTTRQPSPLKATRSTKPNHRWPILVHTAKITQLVRLSREQYSQPSTPTN